VRQYISPPLPVGHDYGYQVRIRWPEGDGTVERVRRLTFRAGDQLIVDYSGTSQATKVRSFYQVPGTEVADDPRPTSIPPSAPLRFVPVGPMTPPAPNAVPRSEPQPLYRLELLIPFDQWSFAPGYG